MTRLKEFEEEKDRKTKRLCLQMGKGKKKTLVFFHGSFFNFKIKRIHKHEWESDPQTVQNSEPWLFIW